MQTIARPRVRSHVVDAVVTDDTAQDEAAGALPRPFDDVPWPAGRVIQEPGVLLLLADDGVRRVAIPCALAALRVAVAELLGDEVRASVRSRLEAHVPTTSVSPPEEAFRSDVDLLETASMIGLQPSARIADRLRRVLAARGLGRECVSVAELLLLAAEADVELSGRDRRRLAIGVWSGVGASRPRTPGRSPRPSRRRGRQPGSESPVDRAAIAERLRATVAPRAQPNDSMVIRSKSDMLVGYRGLDPRRVPEGEYLEERDDDEALVIDDEGASLWLTVGNSQSWYELPYPFTGARYRTFVAEAMESWERELALQKHVDDCAEDYLLPVENHLVPHWADLLEEVARLVDGYLLPPGLIARARRYLAARGIVMQPPWGSANDILWAAARMRMPLSLADDRRLRLAFLAEVRPLLAEEWDPEPERSERHRLARRRLARRRVLARSGRGRAGRPDPQRLRRG